MESRHPNDTGNGICPVCFCGLNKHAGLPGGDYYNIDCPRCGLFKISRTAAGVFQTSESLGNEGSRERANLSSWIRERRPQGMFSTAFFDREHGDAIGAEFWATREPSFHQKADKLLRLLEECTTYAGESIDWRRNKYEYMAISWALNEDELSEILHFLGSQNRIDGGASAVPMASGDVSYRAIKARIMPEGWAHLEKIKTQLPETDQAFVAMWYDHEMDSVWARVLLHAVKDAGYFPQRLDKKQHNNKIDDEIVAEIRKSKFIVADLTGHRGGVYYEAGFAHGLGLPVIWTCRADHFDDLHFDIRQFACIKWLANDLDTFKNELQNRIEATLGRGNYKGIVD